MRGEYLKNHGRRGGAQVEPEPQHGGGRGERWERQRTLVEEIRADPLDKRSGDAGNKNKK